MFKLVMREETLEELERIRDEINSESFSVQALANRFRFATIELDEYMLEVHATIHKLYAIQRLQNGHVDENDLTNRTRLYCDNAARVLTASRRFYRGRRSQESTEVSRCPLINIKIVGCYVFYGNQLNPLPNIPGITPYNWQPKQMDLNP
ncbi:hypothetical protein RF11_12403 [Thelohanellus kitauei]|uniref:Uncharacterized protein n=1 Tax=Thelohanellus kitauei TaxID=669202 RepID=A0A0C2MN71_THEKT|nr:hypothetical protein RF11_12403 [Thelohanellus kitauei]